MSAGVVDWSGLRGLGKGLAGGLEEDRKSTLLQALGGQVQAGDYAGAAKTAFDAGDLQTGLSLVKLGDAKAQTADFQRQFGGGLAGVLGGTVDPSTGTPAAPAPAAPVARGPAFTDAGGVAGSYLATLRGKESGGSATARNPNSSATGIDQFTAGTWEGLRKKYPELGLTPDGRTDVAQSTRAMERFTRDNASVLTNAGVPITPGNLYVAHFLGAGGATRFIKGAINNPEAPAASFVDPSSVAANRKIFYNRDGSPKTAGQVYAERTSRFGGGAPEQPARVQVASADPGFVPQMPSAAAGVSASPAGPTMTLPGADPAPAGATMTLPNDPVAPEQRVQVAQAVPQVFSQAGMNPRAVAQLQATQPGSAARIGLIVKAMSHPGAPEGFKDAMKAALANEYAIDKENRAMTAEQKEYNWDVANGFKGSPMEWRAAKAAATRAPEKDGTEKVAAARQNWQALGLPNPNDPANAAFWKDFGSRALGGGALVNVDTRAEGAEATGLAQARIKDSESYQTAGQAAAGRQVDIQNLRELSRKLGVQGAEASVKEALAPYAQALGVQIDGVGDIQAYSGIIKKLTPNMRPPGSGATSDFEQKLYEKALPGLLQVPETRELVMDMMAAANEGEIRRGDIAQRYRNGEINAPQYAKELRDVPRPLDMFKQFRLQNPTLFEQADKLKDQPGRQLPRGQREARADGGVSGGALKPVPADLGAQAREAISRGAPAKAVFQRLREQGYDPNGLAP